MGMLIHRRRAREADKQPDAVRQEENKAGGPEQEARPQEKDLPRRGRPKKEA